jgi:signal transduction histidine kinase
MPTVLAPITPAELAQFELFKDESPSTLEWLAERFEMRRYEAGEVVTNPGDPADEFMVVLEGELHFMRDGEVYGGAFVRRAGEASGVLPFSRMRVFRGRGWAVEPSRGLFMHVSHLPELIHRAPHLTQRLVNEMIDRARASVQRDERANRMLALGKLSAGLAHELNNPASAVVRSSTLLREALDTRRAHAIAMRTVVVSPEAQALMFDAGEAISEAGSHPIQLDPLERADLECELSDWLEAHRLPPAVASALVDARIGTDRLEPMLRLIGVEPFGHALQLLAADYQVSSLSREIEEASRRIAELIKAVKAYSYMDRAPLTETDVEQGIDITLRMFQHQLKHGFEVKRSFAGNLPKIKANGGELNQVWTNLIDNAIDAMCSVEPKILEIRTCVEPGGVMVDVIDSGTGIPPEVQDQIFDAFFTTKEVGKGTGLGLDIVYRIIHDHHGSIRVDSKPGRTMFQIRLPIGN